jgi:ATP-binding protein involved in chromosome partitioning
MASITKDQILDALRKVKGPDLSGNIVELGLVGAEDIAMSDGKVILAVRVPSERAGELEPLRQAVEKVVRAVPGVASAMVALTAERKASAASSGAPPQGSPAGGAAARPAAPPAPDAGV